MLDFDAASLRRWVAAVVSVSSEADRDSRAEAYNAFVLLCLCILHESVCRFFIGRGCATALVYRILSSDMLGAARSMACRLEVTLPASLEAPLDTALLLGCICLEWCSVPDCRVIVLAKALDGDGS